MKHSTKPSDAELSNAKPPSLVLPFGLACIAIMATGLFLYVAGVFLGFPPWCRTVGEITSLVGILIAFLPAVIAIIIQCLFDRQSKQNGYNGKIEKGEK